jgi:tetratricopeptide (TPR) repeat protein
MAGTWMQPLNVRVVDPYLLQGQIWTKVQKLTNAPRYAIHTEAATAVARGTEFGVQLRRIAPRASIPNPQSSIGSQKSEVRRLKSRIRNVQRPTFNAVPLNLLAVLTVKAGTVDFFNSFGTVQATAMTESTASAASAPTEPKRLETLQVVQLNDSTTWSLLTSPLDWPEAAQKLVGGGGSVGWQLRDVPSTDGPSEVRISQLPSSSSAARADLRLGDVIAAVDGQAVTNARQVSGPVLFRPSGAVNLRVRRDTVEETLAVTVNAETNLLSGPSLPEDTHSQLTELLREWLSAPAGPAPDLDVEKRRFEQVASLTRPAGTLSHRMGEGRSEGNVRAAAFNQLGVVFELEDALGPAVRAYGRAVYLAPEIPLYRFNLGLALRKIGSFERALEEFQEAARLEPDSVSARKRVAEVTSLLDRHEEAFAMTEALLQTPLSRPTGEGARRAGEGAAAQDHSLWELKAQLLLKLQRPAQAIAPARHAAELDPDCPVAHSYLAEAFQAAGRLDEALVGWTEALDRAPFEPAFIVNLGTVQRDLGQTAAAEKCFRRAVALQPDFALAHFNLGNLLADRREHAPAAAAFGKARELDPADARAHWRYGDMLLKQRKFEAAESAYRDALELAPNDPEALYGLGELRRLQRRPADAERAFRRAIELRSHYAAPHTALGIVHYERGDVDEAERFYRRAIELDPSEAAPYHNRGTLYREALVFRALLERSPGNMRLPSLVNLATVCGEQGKLDEAERQFRQALELAPNHPRVANALAAFLADHQLKLDEALALATRAVETAPSDPNFLDTLGWVQAQRGDLDSAERTLESALGLAGQEPPADEIRKHFDQVREGKASRTTPAAPDSR